VNPTRSTTQILHDFGAAYLELFRVVANPHVQAAQFQAGDTPTPRLDTTERSSGMVNDPTATIAYDGRRLALRAAVVAAERELQAADKTMSAAIRHLQDALNRSQGGAA
jgi:hypothetical protein